MVGKIADLSVRIGALPQADTSWLSNLTNTLGGAIDQASQNKSFNSLAERIGGATPVGQPQQSGGFLSSLFRPQESQTAATTAQPSAAAPPQGQPPIAGIQATSQTQPSPSAPRTASQTAGVPEQVGQKSPMEVASTLLGKGEVPDRTVIQEYLKNGGINLDPATTAWCAAYVNSSLAQSGYKGTGSNLARSFLNYGEAVDQPQRGDIAVFSRTNNPNLGHVGFYDSVNPDGSIRILAGNQGDAVSYGNMPSDRLLGYRRPVAGSNGGSVDAVNAMASGQPMPTNQVADASGNVMAPAVTPIQRGGVDPSLIQFMLRDPNLRQAGLQLWQQNVTGKTSEPWQFVTLPDGTLARVNQQTGAVERVGNYAKPAKSDPISVSPGSAVIDPQTGRVIYQADPRATGLGADEAGLNLVYGQDKDGRTIAFQPLKGGGLKQVELPEGSILTPGISNIDTGTGTLTVNNKTGAPVRETVKDVSGEAEATQTGKNSAEAKSALPQVQSAGEQMLSTIDSLANDPYLGSMVGPVDSWRPNLSGSAARVQSKMDQIGGQAFLQAFNMLRGGGQITEIEGKKATDAMVRLNTAQNEGDYRQALSELRGVVSSAIDRARSKAGASAPQGSTDYRNRYGLE